MAANNPFELFTDHPLFEAATAAGEQVVADVVGRIDHLRRVVSHAALQEVATAFATDLAVLWGNTYREAGAADTASREALFYRIEEALSEPDPRDATREETDYADAFEADADRYGFIGD